MALQPLDHFGILFEFHNSLYRLKSSMSADSVCSGLNLHSANLPVNFKKSSKDSPNIDLLFWIILGFQGTPIILKKMLA